MRQIIAVHETSNRKGLHNMKKITAIILTLVMLCSAFAFAETMLVGGWRASESPEITEEIKAMFDKAKEGLLGVDYVPVAYLGSQVVAGTNHCLLCQATVVYPGAQPGYVLVYIYEDLEGNVEILNIADLNLADFVEYGE